MTDPTNNTTPRELGYRWPAEWEPHSAVWLAWPHDPESFPSVENAEGAFADFIHAVHDSEPVELLVLDSAMQERAQGLLNARGTGLERVRFHRADYADIWFRDYGPIFLVNRLSQELALCKWRFNAWGNKYESLLKDDKIPYAMNEALGLAMFEPGIVLEGGSIDGNGLGTILTTEQCLLNPNRNPSLGRERVERYLADYLNAKHVIWLGQGIEGDDTDGHIDDVARFVKPATVLCAYTDDEADADYEPLRRNYELLTGATDQDGRPLDVIKLPTPGRVGDEQGRLPASYANFYIGNSKVIVPVFGVSADARALEVIAAAFPDRKVVGVNALALVYGLGTFHCMTQQQPAV